MNAEQIEQVLSLECTDKNGVTKPLHEIMNEDFFATGEEAKYELGDGIRVLLDILQDEPNAPSESIAEGQDMTELLEREIQKLDKQLSDGVNAILHQEAFRDLEGTWLGLKYLVDNTPSDQRVEFRVVDISKKKLYDTLKSYGGKKWIHSPLYKTVYSAGFDQRGGVPVSFMVGAYEFDASMEDIATLRELGKVAAASFAPFIGAASPRLMGLRAWSQLKNIPNLPKHFGRAEYADWRGLRESDDARYLGLVMPKMLARHPYTARTTVDDGFAFDEDVGRSDPEKLCWANGAFAFAHVMTRAFLRTGWYSAIRGEDSGGGVVPNLVVHKYETDDGEVDVTIPTETLIPDGREHELTKCGLISLSYAKGTNYAVFDAAPSLESPQRFDVAEATASSMLMSRLPYVFMLSRFAHYLKIIARKKVGSIVDRSSLEADLQRWLNRYVAGDPQNASEDVKRKKPLRAAKVTVVEDEENPGYYRTVMDFQPHIDFEGMSTSIRMVSKIRSK